MSLKTPEATERISAHSSRRPKASNVGAFAAGIAGVAVLLALALAVSLGPIRNHLRERYGFKEPEYYERLPADTDANRAAVMGLLAERDQLKAATQEAITPTSPPEPSHGRTERADWTTDGQPFEPPRSLADGFELKRDLCHQQWGLLDRAIDLCRSVDQSATAAEHYAHDVEGYWIPRIQPEPVAIGPK